MADRREGARIRRLVGEGSLGVLAHRVEFGDVGARGKVGSRSGNDDDAHRRHGMDSFEKPGQGIPHRLRYRVAARRPVDGNGHDSGVRADRQPVGNPAFITRHRSIPFQQALRKLRFNSPAL